VALDGQRGEPVDSDQREIVALRGMLEPLQALAAGFVQFAAQVRALQVGLSVRSRGVEQERIDSDQVSQRGQQAGGLKLSVNRIASASMCQLKIEEFARSQAASGAPQSDAGRGDTA
jgi:hypothetical protein